MRNRYRIVTTYYKNYKVQISYWWFPFIWSDCCSNIYPTVELAEAYAEQHANAGKIVKYLGKLP